MIHIADLKASAAISDRYAAMMQEQDDMAHPQMLRVAALEEVLTYAPTMCGKNKTCEGTMKQMEK